MLTVEERGGERAFGCIGIALLLFALPLTFRAAFYSRLCHRATFSGGAADCSHGVCESKTVERARAAGKYGRSVVHVSAQEVIDARLHMLEAILEVG